MKPRESNPLLTSFNTHTKHCLEKNLLLPTPFAPAFGRTPMSITRWESLPASSGWGARNGLSVLSRSKSKRSCVEPRYMLCRQQKYATGKYRAELTSHAFLGFAMQSQLC